MASRTLTFILITAILICPMACRNGTVLCCGVSECASHSCGIHTCGIHDEEGHCESELAHARSCGDELSCCASSQENCPADVSCDDVPCDHLPCDHLPCDHLPCDHLPCDHLPCDHLPCNHDMPCQGICGGAVFEKPFVPQLDLAFLSLVDLKWSQDDNFSECRCFSFHADPASGRTLCMLHMSFLC